MAFCGSTEEIFPGFCPSSVRLDACSDSLSEVFMASSNRVQVTFHSYRTFQEMAHSALGPH